MVLIATNEPVSIYILSHAELLAARSAALCRSDAEERGGCVCVCVWVGGCWVGGGGVFLFRLLVSVSVQRCGRADTLGDSPIQAPAESLVRALVR